MALELQLITQKYNFNFFSMHQVYIYASNYQCTGAGNSIIKKINR